MTSKEQGELRLLMTMLERARSWERMTGSTPEASRVAEGSALAGDDRKSDPYQVSHAAWHALTVAVDNLHCLYLVTKGYQKDEKSIQLVMHVYSPYTLLRASLENAARAVWMLSPNDRKERIARRLQIEAGNAKASDLAHHRMGAQPTRTLEQRMNQLRSIARDAGIIESRIKRVTYQEIVEAAGEETVGNELMLILWQCASAMAHGDAWAMISLSDREVLGEATSRILNLRVTASTSMLVTSVQASVIMIDRGFKLFDMRRVKHY
ncbi:hypothetical protein [Microbispora bryophytorum]|uniref:DUF222 domain-containing protein n=1 Tax=Microbispora bryophytorum subsp. camponoti TaxID=1677852 RepID=A0ABR8LIS6_9ACTN|nr:hypothetical protein [Microbispora camponoti]MBD3148493.1 hypothetical protein [Microbispora camponoti]